MALVNAYATVDELREQLSDTDSRLDQSRLEQLLNAVSRGIDEHCARRFWQDATTSTRVYRVEDHELAWVDDIATTSGLIVRTDPALAGTWTETWTADTDYDLEPANAGVAATGDTAPAHAWWRIAAVGGRRFPVHQRRRTLQVTARFGWSAVPEQVREATLIKASALHKRKDAPHGVAGFGEYGVIRISRYDPDVADLLRPLVRLSAGAP